MRISVRRTAVLGVALAGAMAGGGLAATQAHAATIAETCLNQLSGPGVATDRQVVYPAEPAQIQLSTSSHTSRECRGITVSIGMSRTDLSGYQNKNASYSWGTGQHYHAKYLLQPNQPGSWMTRQIYVRDHQGNTAVRTFTAANSPTKVTVYRESFLEARSNLTPLQDGKIRVAGKLQAHSSAGTRANLANQKVLIQVKRPADSSYTTALTVTTGQYGSFYDYRLDGASNKGKYLRVVFVSPFQTIASDYTWVGVIR
jgi:hypothetical protein